MTPWSFFREIRIAAQRTHGVDFRVMFGKPAERCIDPVMGVYFYHDGKHITLQLNEDLRSFLQFSWVRHNRFRDVSLLSIADRCFGMHQWCILRPSENGLQVTIRNNGDRSDYLPLRSLSNRFYCGENVITATRLKPEYVMHVTQGNHRQNYATSTCTTSAETDWARSHFRTINRIKDSGDVQAEFHVTADVGGLLSAPTPRFWIYQNGVPVLVAAPEAARLGRLQRISHVWREDGTAWETVAEAKI